MIEQMNEWNPTSCTVWNQREVWSESQVVGKQGIKTVRGYEDRTLNVILSNYISALSALSSKAKKDCHLGRTAGEDMGHAATSPA